MTRLLLIFTASLSIASASAADTDSLVNLNHIPSEKLAQLMREKRIPVPQSVSFCIADKKSIRLVGDEAEVKQFEETIRKYDAQLRQVILKFVFGEEGVPPKPVAIVGPIPRVFEYDPFSFKYRVSILGVEHRVNIKGFVFPNPDGSSSMRAEIQMDGLKLTTYLDAQDLVTCGGKSLPKGFRITNKAKVNKDIDAGREFGSLAGLTIGFWPTIIKPEDLVAE